MNSILLPIYLFFFFLKSPFPNYIDDFEHQIEHEITTQTCTLHGWFTLNSPIEQ